MTLPAAPAVDSSASTRGTPALKVVARVREKRATTASWTITPKMGSFRAMRSMASPKASERRRASRKMYQLATMARAMMNHQLCMKSESDSTYSVKAGRSAPKLWKVSANCGTTLTRRMPVTTRATTMTAVG